MFRSLVCCTSIGIVLMLLVVAGVEVAGGRIDFDSQTPPKGYFCYGCNTRYKTDGSLHPFCWKCGRFLTIADRTNLDTDADR